MPVARVIALTALAMIAFAGNSLLCRAAFTESGIDAASFTTIRLASGAVALWLIARIRSGKDAGTGNWISAFALFAYAAGFSFLDKKLNLPSKRVDTLSVLSVDALLATGKFLLPI